MIKLYVTRTGQHNQLGGHRAMERLIEISHWVEKSFGRPDYHTNYTLGFGDSSDDWACWTFFDDTMGFWTQERWADDVLTQEQFESTTMRWGG